MNPTQPPDLTHGTNHPDPSASTLVTRCGRTVRPGERVVVFGPRHTRDQVIMVGGHPPLCPVCFPESTPNPPAPDLRRLAEAALLAEDVLRTAPVGDYVAVAKADGSRRAYIAVANPQVVIGLLDTIDRLTARVAEMEAANAATAKRWEWFVSPGLTILYFRKPGAQFSESVATISPRPHGMLSFHVSGQKRTAAVDLPAALATIRAVLGADVPEIPNERSES